MVKRKGWRNRIVGEDEVPARELVPNPRNWRTHADGQRAALAAVVDDVGWVQRVIVNKRTGHIVDGHLRVEEAASRDENIPVVYVDITLAEERKVLATLDPLGGMAGANDDILTALVEDIRKGATSEALDALLDDISAPPPVDGLTEPDAVPEAPEEPVTKPGDLYQLGPHRLLCGDATSPEDVARLLDGAVPNLMVTDPPYGVNYDPTWRSQGRTGLVPNDDVSSWREAYELAPGPVAYVWSPSLFAHVFAADLMAAGFEIRANIIWAKPGLVMGRGHYHWQHEPCWYVVRKGAQAKWSGDRKQSTLWSIEQVRANLDREGEDKATNHATQKPVECMERPIRNHEGDVYDPFVGSGTTLIAAHRQNRACYAMDVDPTYCDVAIRRFEMFTGQKAQKVVPSKVLA